MTNEKYHVPPDYATQPSNATAQSLSKDTKESIVKVKNFLLLKHVTENIDKELFLVGTFKQDLEFDIDKESTALSNELSFDLSELGSTCEHIEKLSKRLFFDYRMNDLTADEDSGWVKTRRVEMNSGKAKKTFQVKAPLKIEVIFDHFPFKIVNASVTIELSSSSIRDQRRRPNLLLNKKDKASNVAIQPAPPVLTLKKKKKSTEDVITEKMDDSKSYDFLTPFPEVYYYYDKKKKYCPKFKVSFYMVESGTSKFVQIVFPMLLIAILNTVQVLDTGFVENTNYLSNAATFALTAVFILPSIIGENINQAHCTCNNAHVVSIFLGLALSSIPAEMVNTRVPSLIGMVLLWLSFTMPIIGCIRYYWRCASIKKTSPNQIDRYNPNNSQKVIFDDLATVNEIAKDAFEGVDKANIDAVSQAKYFFDKGVNTDGYEVDEFDEDIVVHG